MSGGLIGLGADSSLNVSNALSIPAFGDVLRMRG